MSDFELWLLERLESADWSTGLMVAFSYVLILGVVWRIRDWIESRGLRAA